jgi:hypothetical protein
MMKFYHFPTALGWSMPQVLINMQMTGSAAEFAEMIQKVEPSEINLRLTSIQGDEYYFEGFWIK